MNFYIGIILGYTFFGIGIYLIRHYNIFLSIVAGSAFIGAGAFFLYSAMYSNIKKDKYL